MANSSFGEVDDYMDFGEYSPEMSLFEKGQLYNRIIEYKIE